MFMIKKHEYVITPVHTLFYNIIYYNLHFSDYFVQVLNKLDKAANQFCPFLAAGVVVTTLYWSAASYGAITVMQVYI